MDGATITLIIAIVGCIVGLSGFALNASKEVGDKSSDMTRVETKLDFIADDVKDTKVEIKAMRADTSEAKSLAIKALENSKAAHERLDELNAPSAYIARKKE